MQKCNFNLPRRYFIIPYILLDCKTVTNYLLILSTLFYKNKHSGNILKSIEYVISLCLYIITTAVNRTDTLLSLSLSCIFKQLLAISLWSKSQVRDTNNFVLAFCSVRFQMKSAKNSSF